MLSQAGVSVKWKEKERSSGAVRFQADDALRTNDGAVRDAWRQLQAIPWAQCDLLTVFRQVKGD